ncbi:MAG: DEAD/DEAH box helicase [Hyphomicrobiales bacterium]|nr:MAG: DEAD/DEAH box helicase [Hyphomicrobiales bacterium]
MTSDDLPPAALPPIHPALRAALEAQGYETLTPVQHAVLADEASGVDLLVSAQTGSGKTVAFGLAIAETLLGDEARFGHATAPLGLVIAPTRELAMQVQRELEWLYAGAGVRIASCVGGMDARTERRALERGAHIVVGTPGRLRDHITRHALDLSLLRAVVLDEADEMLDLGFRDDLEFILAAAPEERRTLLFSATVPRAIAELAKTYQRDAVRVTATAASEQHADIEYRVTLVHPSEREHAIINTLLLNDSASALVFCHTREAVRHLTARLANRGFAVVSLSGEMAQSERTSALQAMRDGRARVCVATDVAARGIDLPNLTLVIHADLPSNPSTLLHRSGRTGRAGKKGVCVLIVPLHRRGAAARVLKLANLDASLGAAPGIAEIEARYREQIVAAAQESEPVLAEERDMVEALLSVVSPEQIAAAYLRQQLAARPAPEEITDTPVPSALDGKPARSKRFEDGGAPFERSERAPKMEGGVWFSLALGRKHRADPKWLLPMICKAGGVTKRDVGSIKILDTETRFEIAAEQAASFAAQVAQGPVEKGAVITPVSDGGAPRSYKTKYADEPRFSERKPRFEDKPRFDDKPKFEGKPKYEGKPKFEDKPKFEGKPKYEDKPKYEGKPNFEGKPKFEGKPNFEGKPKKAHGAPAKADKPAKPFVNPKDKGKPKYKGKARPDVGDQARPRPGKGKP